MEIVKSNITVGNTKIHHNMGRTYRKRKRKSLVNLPLNLSSSQCFVNLIQWMKQHGWTPTFRLSPAEFFDTGRGLITEETILKNKVIVSIPVELLVTVSTVVASDIGWLLKSNYNEQFFAQEVLAMFLVWEKHKGQHSAWRPYINTLPSDYSIPLFCSENEIAMFPTFLSEHVQQQRLKCTHGFDAIRRIVDAKTCNHCEQPLNVVFNYKEYEWAWCTVNTRCVYIKESFCTHDLRLKDKANIALAPYLDMFNHSDDALVRVDLTDDKKNYEIQTLVPFSKYRQVFIHYGHHSNLKLYTEYGFVLPSNSHDFVAFSFEEVFNYVHNQGELQNVRLKVDFLKGHSLTKDLSCNFEGLSFNMKAVIYVLILNEKRKDILTQKIYSCEFDDQEKEIICKIGKQLVQRKQVEFETILKVMNDKVSCGSKSFLVGRDLMFQYLHMLRVCDNVLTTATI